MCVCVCVCVGGFLFASWHFKLSGLFKAESSL